MYVVRDSVGPSITKHVQAQRFKNTILRHWPKTTHADGTITFGRLWMWKRLDGGMQRSASHLKLYKVMGIDITDIEKQDKKGLNALYMDVSDLSREIVVGTDDITSYIEQFTPRVYPTGVDPFNPNLTGEVVPATDPITYTDLNPDPYKDGDVLDPDGIPYAPLWDKDGWITSYLEYKPLSTVLIDPNISDADILAKCSGYHPMDVSFADGVFNRLTGTAIMDSNGVLFERQLRVIQRTVEERHEVVTSLNTSSTTNTSRYMVAAKVEFKFRRIADASDVAVAPLITLIEDKIVDINNNILGIGNSYEDLLPQPQLNTQLSINRQLVRMANYKMPYFADGLNYSVSIAGETSYTASDPVVGIRYDKMSELKPQEFTAEFAGRVNSGYDEKPAEWWEIAIVAVLVIIIIIIAILLAIPTGGGSIGWGAASITLLVGSLVLMGLSMYWAENGSPAAARIAGTASEYLGYAAMITGMAGAVQNFIAQTAKQAALETAKAAALEGTKNAATTAAQQAALNAAVATAQAGITSSLTFAGQALMYGSQVGSMAGMVDEETAMYASLVGGGLTIAGGFGVGVVPINNIGDLGDVVMTGVTKFAAMPTTTIMNQTLNSMNVLFNAYILLIAPPEEGIEDKEAQLAAQEKELETLNPEVSETVWKSYTDPYGSIFEVGDIYEKSYISLTSGKNRLLMDKCYVSGY